MTPWQDALFGAAAPVDMRYTPHGSKLGREDFLAGSTDFVISGVPFSDAELAQLPHGKADIVDVPIQVSTLGFLVALPFPNGFQAQTIIPNCDPDDPPPPDFTCSSRTPYGGDSRPEFAGQLKIPSENLGAMMFNYPGSCPWPAPPSSDPHLPINSWTCSPVTEAWGLGSWGVGSGQEWVGLTAGAGPVPVLRSDPDETSYYLQQYVKQVAPTTVWNPLVAEGANSNPRIDWEPITEHFPRFTRVASRDGAGQQAGAARLPVPEPDHRLVLEPHRRHRRERPALRGADGDRAQPEGDVCRAREQGRGLGRTELGHDQRRGRCRRRSRLGRRGHVRPRPTA